MKRDGARKSLWQQDVADYMPTNNWDKDTVYDVLIVGGGVTGLTTALVLQQEGKKCIVAEAHNIGFGTSGGTTAHLNTMLDTAYPQIEKNFGAESARLVAKGSREAIDLIEGLIIKYDIDCDFSYQTAYLFAETKDQAKELEDIKEGADKAGVITGWSETIPVPIPFEKAIRVEFQAQLHATKYLRGLAQGLEKEGGVILQQCLVKDVHAGQYHTADTSLGEIKAKCIVYATHIPPGINIFSFLCAPYRSYAAAFRLKSGNYPDGLAYDMQDPYHYFRTQEIGEQKYVIAGGFDHKTGHNDNTDYVFTELEAYLRKCYDIEAIDYKWSAQYYTTIDGLPYIGMMPGQERIYVATGYSGNGMVLGSLAAKTLCCMIQELPTAYEQLFAPARVKPIAGFAAFVKENADVVSQFIGKQFSYKQITELVELAPGEAVIAKWEGQKVALYKDDNGRLHAIDPVCPHAKCVVTWNSAEKSWDCPCHGSRFAPNGDLLTGPARKGLAQIKWEDIEGD